MLRLNKKPTDVKRNKKHYFQCKSKRMQILAAKLWEHVEAAAHYTFMGASLNFGN
jgi:hypothetical protein